MKQRILVTGGAGFIGSHIADALVAEGHEVHVLDNLSSGSEEQIPPEAHFHHLDVRDAGARELMEKGGFDVLIHHAAQMDVRRSVADPLYDADVNVMGLLNLMEGARLGGVRKVLFASTGGAIYGEPQYVPQDETHEQQPLSPYGITKLVSEKYLHFYYHVYGIPYISLRYANIYGPRQNPHGEAGVVAIFTERMLRGEQPIINGPGTQTRDYLYVEDVVRGNLAALAYEGVDIFNLGTGIETDVNRLFQLLRTYTGVDIEEVHGPAKPGEQQRSVLDYRKAAKKLGWKPLVVLEEGLQRTVQWFKEKLGKTGK